METLEDLGYNQNLEDYRTKQGLNVFDVGRVILEHKDRYVVKTDQAEFDAELIGNLRFTAESKSDLPAVGDWVAISEYEENKALIHAVFPRHSVIQRQASGKNVQSQLIATNVDYGLIVQAVGRDFNINRLQRYLTICNASNIEPIIILSKIDLISGAALQDHLKVLKERIEGAHILTLSNLSGSGIEAVKQLISKGKTYCLLGSSGVGKSTLLNNLSGKALMNTGEINEGIDRGRHITTHRELIVLESGGIIIDNPGMREIGLTDTSTGLDITFDKIVALSQQCKFNNCTHTSEKGCAILSAVENGTIDSASFDNFQKMEKERAFFESSVAEKKKKDKDLGKLIRNVKKLKNRGLS